MVCKHCDNSDVTVGDLQGAECSISCSNSSPCNSCMELANLEDAIARLKMKRCELKRNINRTHSPFIRMIPPEIIATISEFANTDLTTTGNLHVPILLSSVCSDWRRTVVGTPELWSSIKIDLPLISQASDSDMPSSTLLRLATLIDEWLARSGQLPLYISLCSRHKTPSDRLTLEKYQPVFKVLNQYSSRWQTLNITFPPTLLPFLQPACLPLLKHLDIRVTTGIGGSHAITFPPTPCLNTVKIQPFINIIFPPFSNIEIQWHTVTHVFVELITTHNCFLLLRRIPLLVHCTFHKVIDRFENSFSESPILSRLMYLSLHHKSDPFQVLNNMKLPSLETLVLFNVSSIDPLMAFLERSACSLHTLSLPNCHIQKIDKLTRLLQFLSPSLKTLAISRPPSLIRVTESYLSILIQIYTSQSEVAVVGSDFFLPHLETFIYECREEYLLTLESSMLSNLPPPSRNYLMSATSISLRSAYINKASIINWAIPHDISSILQHLEEDGILTYT